MREFVYGLALGHRALADSSAIGGALRSQIASLLVVITVPVDLSVTEDAPVQSRMESYFPGRAYVQ